MDSIRIQGGVALEGKARIQGSKNAALPILAATLLTGGCSFIGNCPRIADVHSMVTLLKELGCSVGWQGDGLYVDSSTVCCEEIGTEAVTAMRSSLCLLGALLGRCGKVDMEHPGGCVIGSRPIDMHIAALRRMGVEFCEEDGRLKAKAQKLCGAHIRLPFPSVGATENVILAAVLADGDTLLEGAALEPEIAALCGYLTSCGARIEGAGTGRIAIRGTERLHGAEYFVPADRIVAGTYLFGCIGAGGCVFLEDAPWRDMAAVIDLASRMGAALCTSGEGVFVQAPDRPRAVKCIRTKPYPGFPTDLQSVVLAVASGADGDSLIRETIFENRFRVVGELRKMGARISEYDGNIALVHGVDALRGACVEGRELRGGAALVVAGLMAQGETTVTGCNFIYRGYENICRDFRELGARVTGA